MQKKMPLAFAAAVASFFLLAQFAPRQADSNQTQTSSDARQLQSLLVQRRDTIKQQLDIVRAHQATGRGSAKEIAVVQDRLFMAEFDLATKKSSRVSILESRVKNLERLEAYSKRMVDTGVDTVENLLAAKEQRLSAQIDLYRVKVAK